MTNRETPRFTLIVTTAGDVEIELPETFAEGDRGALVAAVQAVRTALR